MEKNKNTRILVLTTLLTIIAIALTLTTYGALTSNKNISTTGGINVSANLGVYSDSACQTPITTLNWGNLNPGATTTQTIYIKNTGAGVALSLNMTTSLWNPSIANGPITVTWNKESTQLAPGDSTPAVLTLTVSSSITNVTTFSVQINLTGTES